MSTTSNEREFRDALGFFATGVVIITAAVDGNRIGATVSSFNSVSLTPRLVLFSIARSSHGLAQWKAARCLAISLLCEHQTDLSNKFARATGDKWVGLEDRRSNNGSPLLPGVLAHFECVLYAVHDGGDHDIFVCEVTSFTIHRTDLHPLVFYGGKYRKLGHLDRKQDPPDENLWLHGW